MIEELILSKSYNEALEMLQDMSDENTRYLRLVCLTRLKEYQKAKEEGLLAMNHANETYYDVLSMYVNALKELKEYEKAIDILLEELSSPNIPYQYQILFNDIYEEIIFYLI